MRSTASPLGVDALLTGGAMTRSRRRASRASWALSRCHRLHARAWRARLHAGAAQVRCRSRTRG